MRKIVYRRKDSPNWYYSFTVKGKGRFQGNTETHDERSANQIAEAIRTDILRGKHFGAQANSLKIEKLLDWGLKALYRSNENYSNFQYHVKLFVDFLKSKSRENSPANELKKDDVEMYRENRLLSVSTASINRELTTIKAIFIHAQHEEKISTHPFSRIKFYSEVERQRDRFLIRREKDLLITKCFGILRDIVVFALKTGMRQGEILKLRWENINDKGQIRVFRKKGGTVRKDWVTIHEQAFSIIRQQPRHGEFVFSHEDGKPLSRHGVVHSTYRRIVQDLIKKHSIPHFNFHDLRHTFASDFLAKGGSLKALSDIMGHSATYMTERYGHLTKEHLGIAVNLIPAELCYAGATVEKEEIENNTEMLGSQSLGL